MNITLKLSRTNEIRNIELQTKSTVNDVLKKINLKPDTAIIMCKNQPIPIDEEVTDGQELTILQVSSGG